MFTFTVHPDSGEPFEATATSRDVARWEAGGRGRSLSRLGEQPSMSDLYDLSFLAVERLGLFDGDIRAWREQVDLQFEDPEPDTTGPTRRGP